MKKVLLVMPLLMYGFIVLMILMLLFAGGESGGSGGSVPIVATEDQAYAYQYVSAELGVPWDLALLSDAILADQQGKDSLKDCNPLITSLEFCIVSEIRKVKQATETDQIDPATGQARWEITYTEISRQEYAGTDAILEYMGLTRKDAEKLDVPAFLQKVEAMVESKDSGENDTYRYGYAIDIDPDFERILLDSIGLSPENCRSLMQLYSVNYMSQLYGYVYEYGDIMLPELVQGEVYRSQLAQTAASLIGHPYLLGGKSPQPGIPKGPLDCSGFVDWVYIQCFGTGVSGGTLPEGVAVSGTALQWYATSPVSEEELQVGDLAFLYDPASLRAGKINHVGIFIGRVGDKEYFIHCAGKSFGTPERPSGRVGISVRKGSNSYNCVTGGRMEPAMKGCNFKFFRRPNFGFLD